MRSINFISQRSRYVKKSSFGQYYVESTAKLYRDSVSDLVCALADASGGKVVARLAQCYDKILIDELQDLTGYDLNLLVRFLKSGMRILTVDDPRQSVYVTNTSSRNKNVRRAAIVDWIEGQEKVKLLSVTTLTESYHCNQVSRRKCFPAGAGVRVLAVMPEDERAARQRWLDSRQVRSGSRL